ncbi:MAG: helix-turn-helix domain-containing protein [Candidatus Cryptobacteroides sp.]|nr:helix-turn-helix domain-containing protein [Candidatus Cryptobacteroides sp.]
MSQNRELDIARFIVEKTDSNIFLTGKAGTGKTTFLKDVKKYTKKNHIVLAPTGVAAVNAGAMTIHSFFQFGFGPYVKGISEPEGNYMMRREKRELIKSLELIIIDEISMVRADVLDHINDELQRIRRNSEPFGGVQLLMIGDLQQLPPITPDNELEILKPHYDSMYFFDSKSLRNSDYYCIELKSVYRQTDQRFIDILNRVRTGDVTHSDLDELNSHHVADFRPAQGDNYIQLVTHNRMADAINQREMAALSADTFMFDAKVTGTFPEDAFPTSRQLEIKKGAQVMFVKNDPDKRFINGMLGEVEEVSNDSIRVRLSGKDNIVKVEPTAWENIRYHMNEETHKIESTKIGSFMQYPIKPAWAITIHKSQGLTFDKAVIDAHEAFSPGQAYVALSRCRSLDGMVLSEKLTQRAIITDSIVDEYMNGAVQDIDALARNINFEPFDYDRTTKETTVAKNANGHVTVVNTNVFDALKEWRTQVASVAGVPAYVVMYDRTLAELANALPERTSELDSIHGLGPVKIEKYGQALLDVIHSSRNASNSRFDSIAKETEAPILEPVKKKKENKEKEKKEKTWVITYKMYKEGKTVMQIAQERSLTETTILGHLARYVESGDIDVHKLVSNDVIEKVSVYMSSRNGGAVAIKEVFEYFNETISYGDIRLVLSHLNSMNQ